MAEEIEVVCQQSSPDLNGSSPQNISDVVGEPEISSFVPSIRSGSFVDRGPRGYMEDEHIRIDDLSLRLGSFNNFPIPDAFYGVFDGHSGSGASTYMKHNVIRLLFEDVILSQRSEADDTFLQVAENAIRNAFLRADQALADHPGVGNSGTTAITAMIFGKLLMVANVGDCRAVLCRKGKAIEMSQDHKPTNPSELRRVEESGGFIKFGYLNGTIAVTRALGDWGLKSPKGGSACPLIAEPDMRHVMLTEEDEFLIIGCDGIWDVMSSKRAIRIVQSHLRRHGDPAKCAKSLVFKARCFGSLDNLTAVVVCFSVALDHREPRAPHKGIFMCCRPLAT